MSNNTNTIKWLLHGLIFAPVAHLLIGLPLFFALFAGSVSFSVGILLLLAALLLPFELLDSLALTYTVTGKIIVGLTLYHGWPLVIMSLAPALYLLVLASFNQWLKGTNFAGWVTYIVETTWRLIALSFVVFGIAILVGFSLKIAAILSSIASIGYLAKRLYRFYTPLWSQTIRMIQEERQQSTML
ncbi:hypothetical protein C9I98_08245 [Photobacterium sanctipauli]|uniref:Uncharacterized protein n=1 Tax=Photobacterium sanctipauli TaxID=1342794 RepID=A0A2T3NX91_9GAMM|nr:hypothetical protein [Photobacterium sanctipauli]PSW20818.1 hypothetical protein C9I98_08245 [Photobacterium sanctipauli]